MFRDATGNERDALKAAIGEDDIVPTRFNQLELLQHEVKGNAVDLDEHLIDVPRVSKPTFPSPESAAISRTKL